MRNAPFTTNLEKKIEEVLSPKGFRSTQWFLGYIPIPDWQYGNPETYYSNVFFNPYAIVDFLFNYFGKVYKTLKETAGLEELLDRSVEERKTQLQKAP